jgi:spore germination protein GerM
VTRAVPAVAATLLAVVFCACSVGPESSATPIEDVPFDLLDPDAPNVIPVTGGRTVPVCLLRDDRLVVVERQLEPDAGLREVLVTLAATSDAESTAGLESAVSGSEEIAAVDIAGGIATVDFEATADQALTPDPLATIAQIVCTLTGQPGIGAVRFTVGGDAIDVPREDGSLTDTAVTRDDYRVMFENG